MSKILGLVLALFLANACVNATPINTLVQSDESLVNYMQQPNVVAADPAVTALCFQQYLPQLSEIANIFSSQYEACVTLANQQTANLTATATNNRVIYTQQANDICNSYQACNNESDILTFFNCYTSASNQDVSGVYDLSNGAAGAAVLWTNGLQSIATNQNQCTNVTRNTYITQTAATYRLLDSCLQNGGVTTTEATTTATSTETEPTTPVSASAGNDTNTENDEAIVFNTQCSNGSGTRTQTSADGTQTQTQTGPGCPIQNSGSDTQEQSQRGSGTQTQCSGSDCGNFEPMKPMQPMQPMQPIEPIINSVW